MLQNRTSRIVVIALFALGSLVTLAPTEARADGNWYSAIAYSPSTGAYGYSYNCRSLAEAKQLALSYCDYEDARIVVWVRNGWCALAVGDDGAYGYAWASTQYEARRLALAYCQQYSNGRCRIKVTVFSGD